MHVESQIHTVLNLKCIFIMNKDEKYTYHQIEGKI